MPKSKSKALTGCGGVGMAGVWDRATSRVAARRVAETDRATLQGSVRSHAGPVDKRPMYRQLVADSRLPSGARA